MALFNEDGTPYKASGELSMFNPQSPENCLFNAWDEEAIRIGGSPIYYYEIFIQSGTIDPLYLEDRGALFSPNPITLYANYEPSTNNSLYQSTFGNDSINEEVIFELNYSATLRAIGHPPKAGSRIFSPHRGENWEIINYSLDEFRNWGAVRLKLLCAKFIEKLTNNEGQVTKNFKIN